MGTDPLLDLRVPGGAPLNHVESVAFLDPLATGVDAAIREAQRCIVEALDLDGCMLFEPNEDGDLLGTYSWWRPAVAAPPARLSARESFPWMFPRLLEGELVCLSSPDGLSDGVDRSSLLRFGLRSIVVIPLSVHEKIVGVVSFGVTRSERDWPLETIQRLRLSAGLFASVLARRHSDEALCRALGEVKRLTDQLRAENVYLRREVESTLGTSTVGRSAAILHVQEQVRQVAETDATVLLLGETGSGKEVFASQIHELSRRRGRAMVRVNCAAIPTTLIESELFGREKGAYTGALSRQAGRFELADGSTIFLDEIGDLPLDVQVKLLRVLEDRQVERLGSSKATKINTRIIAATHRDLEKRIRADAFREDLYYRLNVFPIRVPPLRERIEDIPMLVWRFVEEFSKAFGKRIESIPKDNIDMLQRYPWPGQRSRAAQSGGARGDRRVWSAFDHRVTAGFRRATQRAARRRGEGTRQERARQHRVADSRRGRRCRTAGTQSHDPRDAHGEVGTPPRASLTPAFRAPSAILGNTTARLAALKASIDRNSKQQRSMGPALRAAPNGTAAALAAAWYASPLCWRLLPVAQSSSFIPSDSWPRPPASNRAASGVESGPRTTTPVCGTRKFGRPRRRYACGYSRRGLLGFSSCWSPHRSHPAFGSISSRTRAAWTTSRRCARWMPRSGLIANPWGAGCCSSECSFRRFRSSGLHQLIQQRAIVVFRPEFRSCDNGAAATDSGVTSY